MRQCNRFPWACRRYTFLPLNVRHEMHPLGQLATAKANLSTGTVLSGQQFASVLYHSHRLPGQTIYVTGGQERGGGWGSNPADVH